MTPPTRPVTALHGLWVAVFAVEATFKGADLGHQLGALVLGLLFGGLLVGELRSTAAQTPQTPEALQPYREDLVDEGVFAEVD